MKKRVALKEPPKNVIPFPRLDTGTGSEKPTLSTKSSGLSWPIILLIIALVILPLALFYLGEESTNGVQEETSQDKPQSSSEAETGARVTVQEQVVSTVAIAKPAAIQREQLETWQWLVLYYQTTGEAENEALSAAGELAKVNPGWAAEYGVRTISNLLTTGSIGLDTVPFYERCVKFAQELNPTLQKELEQEMTRLRESAQANSQKPTESKASPTLNPTQEEVPAIPFLIVDTGISTKYGWEPVTKKPVRVETAGNQWRILTINKVDHLTLLTLQQASPENSSSPIIPWVGIAVGNYEVGQVVDGVDLVP